MEKAWLPPIIITCFWAFIGIICPFFARGPNKGITQCCLMLVASTCWLFWLCCYMTQMNPLIGPKLTMNEIMIVAREWGNPIEDVIDITYQ
ncbi:V-type proton ATPase subunit e [Anastrepha obliqua]|uniref:V-type proton ATPase subunit e n=1 Tax=Anastrepha ludens TaxID=28586 RepID=UPI0023AED93F|nr:V-type proton ATPase subunit e [Anastrepha ludens]XP_054733080.1 V-type proton ATPase subunit e [Anastrepha obliqua]